MKSLKSFLSKIKNIRNIDIGEERNFRRDWTILAVAGILAMFSIFIGLWYLGSKVHNDPASVKVSNRAVLTVNRSLLTEVIDFYKNQDQNFERTKTESLPVSDPSK